MGKWLFLAALVLVGYLILKARRRSRDDRRKAPVQTDTMVACEHCGLPLPKGDSIEVDGRFFCCTEHRGSGTR